MMLFKQTFWQLLLLLMCAAHPLLAQKKKDLVDAPPAYDYLSPLKSKEEIRTIENKLERLFYLYCGEFSNEQQVEELRKDESIDLFYSIRQKLITIPIWQERTGEYWFYSGWFIASQMDKPLTHTIGRMTRENRDSFKITFYQLPVKEDERGDYQGEWRKQNPFQELKPKHLVQTPGCENYVLEVSNTEFLILPSDCPLFLSEQRQYLRYKAKITVDALHQYTEYLNAGKEITFAYKIADGLSLQRIEVAKPIATKKKGK